MSSFTISRPAAVADFLDDLALNVTLTRLHEAEALDHDDEPLAVRCVQCNFAYHPDCLVCVMGGRVA